MNLLLLRDDDLLPDGTVRLVGRRAQHVQSVLKVAAGDSLRVGKLGGLIGSGRVEQASGEEVRLSVELREAPPPRPGVDLLLAMPRPKALKKVLPAIASLGVDRVVLINAYRVEKSYFDAKVLSREWIDDLLCLGLEQARDTILPRVELAPRFRPFVEDSLAMTFGEGRRCVLHPTAPDPLAAHNRKPGARTVIAIGPEGGWIPFEIELLEANGFRPFSLGPRILRVEVCVPFVLGKISERSF